MTIIAHERFVSFVTSNETLSERGAEFLEQITRQVNLSTVLTGSGSPEGVLIANPTSLYMDTSGSAGNILYIKQSGTGSTGWILV